jgi:hypothetical protein
MTTVWEDVRQICWSQLNHEELQQGHRGEVGRFKVWEIYKLCWVGFIIYTQVDSCSWKLGSQMDLIMWASVNLAIAKTGKVKSAFGRKKSHGDWPHSVSHWIKLRHKTPFIICTPTPHVILVPGSSFRCPSSNQAPYHTIVLHCNLGMCKQEWSAQDQLQNVHVHVWPCHCQHVPGPHAL